MGGRCRGPPVNNNKTIVTVLAASSASCSCTTAGAFHKDYFLKQLGTGKPSVICHDTTCLPAHSTQLDNMVVSVSHRITRPADRCLQGLAHRCGRVPGRRFCFFLGLDDPGDETEPISQPTSTEESRSQFHPTGCKEKTEPMMRRRRAMYARPSRWWCEATSDVRERCVPARS